MKNIPLNKIRERIAILAIGSSTLRNQGAPKVKETAQNYLAKMNLNPLIKVSSENEYRSFLDRHTKALSNKFPSGAKGNWGAARKAINIFLRDCLYNTYICNAFDMEKMSEWLELPLDSYTGKALKKTNSKLPRWKTIKGLKAEVSDKFQQAALSQATKNQMDRVHLDIEYWRNGKYN